jgi:hypothetical protein
VKTSSRLVPGSTYSRADLRATFLITDATLNTGVFRPAGTDSIWLFVTEEKAPDRTDYLDLLDGDVLEWDGQMSGRTDSLIIEHELRSLELLLFYRKHKYEFPHAAFRYEGPFRYEAHSGSMPAHFRLRRALRTASKAATVTERQ